MLGVSWEMKTFGKRLKLCLCLCDFWSLYFYLLLENTEAHFLTELKFEIYL